MCSMTQRLFFFNVLIYYTNSFICLVKIISLKKIVDVQSLSCV